MVTINKGPGYQATSDSKKYGFQSAMCGMNIPDPDSAQVAVGWENADGSVFDKDTNADPEAVVDALPSDGKMAAKWQYEGTPKGSETVTTTFTINPNAKQFDVVLVYTDALSGMWNDRPDDATEAYPYGDLPLIIGSWNVTWNSQTNNWDITKKGNDVSYIETDLGDDFQHLDPTTNQITTWTNRAKEIVAKTGCTLNARRPNVPGELNRNSGYNVYK